MAMAFNVRTNSVSATQPARAMSIQRPCRRVSDSLRVLKCSMALVGLCCRLIDAPGRCFIENWLCMQALLSCLIYYHMFVQKALRKRYELPDMPNPASFA